MKFKNDTVYTTKGKKWTLKKLRSEYRHQVLGRRGIQKKRLMANPKKILNAHDKEEKNGSERKPDAENHHPVLGG